MERGTLFLVVGPSGAGKDTLLDGARARLAGDRRYLFPRRVITRPAGAGGEDHQALTQEEFARRSSEGGFLLEWQAHGLRYGIPAEAGQALAEGRHVVANLSRSVLEEARRRFAPVRIISIIVPATVLRARLQARGREDAADIAARLQRVDEFAVSGADVVTIVNDGTAETGTAALLAALRL